MRDRHGNHICMWSKNVKKILDDTGFTYLWNNVSLSNVQIQNVIQRIYDQYLQQWFSDLRTQPKLETYCLLKTDFEPEKYISCVKNENHRISLTRFRCSAHNLLIEEGRHRNIERNLRICTKCNMNVIENEYHFLLVCPFYRELRIKCLPNYYCHWPNLFKFKNLLNSSQSSTIIKLAKYIYQSFSLRG